LPLRRIGFRPKGADVNSQGWSAAEPLVTRTDCIKPQRGGRDGRPFGALLWSPTYQGFRCAPPLAIDVRPVGAKTGRTGYAVAPVSLTCPPSWDSFHSHPSLQGPHSGQVT